MASYDPVGYALATDALTHDGPADPARIDPAVCLQEFPPGVAPQETALALPVIVANIGYRFATGERADREPSLRCYVTDTCADPPGNYGSSTWELPPGTPVRTLR